MGIYDALDALVSGFQIGRDHVQFRLLLEKHRQAASEELANFVQQGTPDELERVERWLLQHAIVVVGQSHRLRALELYAFFKLHETMRYKEFRGFPGDAGPLA